MTYALVVGAAPREGSDAYYAALLAEAAFVVAADAAAEWCVGLGRVPDVAVGDFDSARSGAVERLRALGVGVETFPCDKDATDLELAVDVALARGAAPVVITAAFSRRLDHTLAAVGALARAGAGASAREPGWSARACVPGSDVVIEATDGAVLSVIAVGDADGVWVNGARWPLVASHLPALSGRGVSNLATGPVTVSVTRGTLVVFLLDDVGGGLY